jgi:predicted transcriptional regulator
LNERIPDAELDVLACLERLGESTARQLRETMRAYRPMAHGSMMTLLKRLEERGLVAREKAGVGKAFVFRCRPAAAGTLRGALTRLRERLFDGDSVALVASLFEGRPPDSAELAELQELLDKLRGDAGAERNT